VADVLLAAEGHEGVVALRVRVLVHVHLVAHGTINVMILSLFWGKIIIGIGNVFSNR
jgi:hypothetical protein